jgi:hypothetical protein
VLGGTSVVSSVNENLTRIKITGNIITFSASNGININQPSGPTVDGLEITGNIVTDDTIGIWLEGAPGNNWYGVSVINNIVERSSSTSNGTITLVSLQNADIQGNTINTSAWDGIQCLVCSNVTIHDNYQTGITDVALYSSSSTGTRLQDVFADWATISATGTILNVQDRYMCNANAGNVVVSLPAYPWRNERHTIRRIDSNASYACFVGGYVSIDGGAQTLSSQWSTYVFEYNGTTWSVVSKF